MSNKIVITSNGSYINIEIIGDVAVEKLYAVNSFLYHDREFIDNPYAIWDFSGSTIDMEMERVVTLAGRVMKDRHFDTKGKTAFISNDDTVLSMGESFAGMMNETMPFEIRGFHDKVSAVQWVTDRGIEIVKM